MVYVIHYMEALEREEEQVGLLNKKFSQVHDKFMEYGWELTTNTPDKIVYSYPISAYDEFHIGVAANGISVSTPVPLGNFAYRVDLNTYADAIRHILTQLDDFETKRKRSQYLYYFVNQSTKYHNKIEP